MGMMQLFGFGKATFSHGIHPPEYKAVTEQKSIRRLAFAPEMILPLSQHFGAPSIPVVHVGQEVVRGELVARADADRACEAQDQTGDETLCTVCAE